MNKFKDFEAGNLKVLICLMAMFCSKAKIVDAVKAMTVDVITSAQGHSLSAGRHDDHQRLRHFLYESVPALWWCQKQRVR